MAVAQTTADSSTTLCYAIQATCASADLVSKPSACTSVGQTYLTYGTTDALSCAGASRNLDNLDDGTQYMYCNTANCNTAARFADAQAAASPAAKLAVAPCVLALVAAGVAAAMA